VLATQEFVANGGGRPGQVHGAALLLHRRGGRQPWPCRSAWLLAFQSDSAPLRVTERRPRVGGFRWLRVLPNGGRGTELRRTAREGPPALSVVVEVGEFERAEAG
jgi:hypothetical protein